MIAWYPEERKRRGNPEIYYERDAKRMFEHRNLKPKGTVNGQI
jgi:hypothetical protein